MATGYIFTARSCISNSSFLRPVAWRKRVNRFPIHPANACIVCLTSVLRYDTITLRLFIALIGEDAMKARKPKPPMNFKTVAQLDVPRGETESINRFVTAAFFLTSTRFPTG